VELPGTGYDVVGSIVLYRTAEHETTKAIEQFLAVPLSVHLCIIDNSPERRNLGRLDPARVTYHHPNANLGYGRAHNVAIRAARGRSRYSLVMNTDIDYGPEVVTRLVQFLDGRPGAGMACPRICNADGSLQYWGRLLPTPSNFFLRRFLPTSAWAQKADYDYELRWWNHASVANLPYFQGSYMMLRTELANRLGGFDERFFMYGEDIDLTRRMHAVSETLYFPEVSIVHEYRRMSNRGWRGTWIGIQNNCRYLNKWGWLRDRQRDEVNQQVRQSLRG
jgi:GT2 family glycosyltransferase